MAVRFPRRTAYKNMTGDQTTRQALPRSSASIFAELADRLYEHSSEDDVYGAICRSAPALVTGCDHASIMIRRNDKFVTVGSSDEIAAQADALERELANGPCVDAIEEEMVQVDSDLTDGCQWPDLAKRLLATTPIRGMAGFRLLIDGKKVGALNLFSDTAGALNDKSRDEAAVLASFASVTLAAQEAKHSAATMLDGLESNREIGKAVGLMMAFHKVDDVEAYAILRRTSQNLNMKLARVAQEIIGHHNDGSS